LGAEGRNKMREEDKKGGEEGREII